MDFFFNDTATTEIYTLSLHDALPILSGTRSPSRWTGSQPGVRPQRQRQQGRGGAHRTPCEAGFGDRSRRAWEKWRSEEHTSELQSRQYLVCRLLLEKKLTFHT